MKRVILLFLLLSIVILAESQDYSHPKNYVNVFEIDENGKRWSLFNKEKQASLYEVDINSKIEIEFDREYMQKHGFDYKINLGGTIKSGEKSRAIEVASYSVIGEKSISAEKSFYRFSDIANTLDSSHLDISEEIVYITNGMDFQSLSEIQNKKIRKVIVSKKTTILNELEEILTYSDEAMEMIRDNLIEETGNNREIKKIVGDIIDEYNKKDSIDLEKIDTNLTILARYGDALIGGDGLKTKNYKKILALLETPLRDTEIMISETGGQEEDAIILSIKNKDRELKIKFVIRTFGLITEIQDSYLFIKGENESSYNPIPGITLARTYVARKDEKLLRMVYPGFGINVSFPQADDGSTDVSAGLTVSIFKNSVILTAGKELSSKDQDTYYGIGFSFLKIAGKIFRN